MLEGLVRREPLGDSNGTRDQMLCCTCRAMNGPRRSQVGAFSLPSRGLPQTPPIPAKHSANKVAGLPGQTRSQTGLAMTNPSRNHRRIHVLRGGLGGFRSSSEGRMYDVTRDKISPPSSLSLHILHTVAAYWQLSSFVLRSQGLSGT